MVLVLLPNGNRLRIKAFPCLPVVLYFVVFICGEVFWALGRFDYNFPYLRKKSPKCPKYLGDSLIFFLCSLF